MNAYAAYSQNQTMVQSDAKMFEMLYEGALRFLVRTKRAMKDGDIEQKCINIRKVIAILNEFLSTIDYENGGDVSYYLQGLYTHQISTLSKANLDDDLEKVDEVIRVIRGLLEAWREVNGISLTQEV